MNGNAKHLYLIGRNLHRPQEDGGKIINPKSESAPVCYKHPIAGIAKIVIV